MRSDQVNPNLFLSGSRLAHLDPDNIARFDVERSLPALEAVLSLRRRLRRVGSSSHQQDKGRAA